MYSPYVPNSDLHQPPQSGFYRTPAEEEEASESGTETDTDLSDSSIDGQMDALSRWQAAARASVLSQSGAASLLVPVGDSADATATPDETDTGMFNTRIAFEERQVSHVVMVNSLDRDQSVYPLPTQLRLKLPRVYKNVERIDIVQVKFFCGLYAISAARKNNTIALSLGVATVPDGTYTLSQLLIATQAALVAAGVAGCSVSFNPVTGRVTISSTGTFSLLFKSALPVFNQSAYSEWGLGWNLGFGGQPADLSGSASYSADHFPRLSDDYIYLQMNETEHMNVVDHTDVEKTGRTQDSTGQVSHYFGKLLLNNFGCWAQTFIEAPKTFKPVLGRLERLDFTWTDRRGNSLTGLDAASCDWHMALRITEIVEVAKADSSITQSRDRNPTAQ